MNGLIEYKFSDLYEMSSGISSKPEQAGHGAPFVSFSTVFNHFFLPKILNDFMDTTEKEQEIYSIKIGDIFLTRTSETIDELGMSSVALEDYPKATFSGFTKRLRPKQNNIAYHRYMAFYLRSKFFRKTMTNNAIMTLRASLNEDIFSYLKLHLPNFTTQKTIGDFLFSLYEKTEINNSLNTEMECLTKLIYDFWFIQFDFPNEEGKPYKTSGSQMVWNELMRREIPLGWEVKRLGDYAEVAKGELITEKEAINGNVKVVAGGINYAYHHNECNRDENTITISGSGASAGYVNFWHEPIFASDCTTVRGKTTIETILLFHYLKQIQSQIFRLAKGSAQPHVYPNDIRQLFYVVPPQEIFEKAGQLLVNMIEGISINQSQNGHLLNLMDWLLPMLLNGQVKIDEVGQELAMAAEPEVVYRKRK